MRNLTDEIRQVVKELDAVDNNKSDNTKNKENEKRITEN